MAKQPKSVGPLDSLPDHILCHILSFLPPKEAARTSLLSPRWRYLFVSSISTLDFKGFISRYKIDGNFLNFVDRFFSNPKLVSLECFRVHDFWVNYDRHLSLRLANDISCMDRRRRPWDDDHLRLKGWICAALGRGVKELDIFTINKQALTLPPLLFTCQSLVTLKLKIKGIHDVPTNACLPNLKTLHFTLFEFLGSHSVLKLISSCPVLEDLAFDNCRFCNTSELIIHSLSLKRLALDFGSLYVDSYRGLKHSYRGFKVIDVNAPSLVCFKYVDRVAQRCTLGEMKSLERAHIGITLLDDEDHERATNLLGRVCHVQSLYLAIHGGSKTLVLAPLDPMHAFVNLVELEICHYYTNGWQGRWIVEFLHCMPNLKTLILNLTNTSEGFGPLPTIVPWSLLFNVKEIKIKYFEKEEHMFEMVSYFLEHALAIEKLIISDIGVHERNDFRRSLTNH